MCIYSKSVWHGALVFYFGYSTIPTYKTVLSVNKNNTFTLVQSSTDRRYTIIIM